MLNNWFIVKSFGIFYHYRPIWLISLFLITLFLGFSQGISIVLLVPLLSILEPAQTHISTNKWGVFINNLFGKLGIEINLTLILIIFAISLLLVSLLNYFQSINQATYQQGFSYQIRKKLFKKLIMSDWIFLNEKSKYNHFQLLTMEISKMSTYYYFYLGLAARLIFILSHVIMALVISVKFTLFILATGFLVFLFSQKYLKKAIALGLANIHSFRIMLKQIDDFWLTVKMSKVHNTEEFHFRKFDISNRQVLLYQNKQIKNRAIPQLFFSLSGAVAIVVVVYYAFNVINLPMEALVVLILLFARIYPQFMGLNGDLNILISNVESVRMVLAMDQEMEEHEFDKKEMKNEISFFQLLEIRNLNFGFHPNNPLFTNFCETIPAQQMTGIIGKSGIGKTTLIDIIAGLQTLEDEVIIVDGIVLSKDKLPTWKNELAYLPQDSFFIDGTIRENLIWDSEKDLTDSQILDILKMVNAEQLVLNQKEGLDTTIANFQYYFSGGERQRLALARVLIRKPRLLLLDEATSALDTENEMLIMDCLLHLKKNITIVFVTHKKSLMSYFDKIIDLNLVSK
jgi:ABC-type multidrug transport system fused ATPase/permease subunit